MRLPWLWLALAACDATPPPTPPKPDSCPVICTTENNDCAFFPYDQLPPRCQDICYWGTCCAMVNGTWQMATIECAPPIHDAGVDASSVDSAASAAE